MDVSKIQKEYDKLKAAMTATAPFISSLLSRARILLSTSVPTAGISNTGVMAINPDFWSKLSWAGKAWILGHETLHIAFRDHRRQGSRDLRAWNFVADGVNNEMEKELLRMPTEIAESCVSLEKIFYGFSNFFVSLNIKLEDLQKMSKEELYRILPKVEVEEELLGGRPACPQCGSEKIRITRLDLDKRVADMKCDDCGAEWQARVDLSGGGGSGTGTPIPIDRIEGDLNIEGEGEVLQEGDPEIYKEGEESDGENIDEKWKEAVARAYDIQKTIGTVPVGLKRIVDALLKPRVDWRNFLRQAFKVGFGRTVVSTWKRPSRKNPEDFPGIMRYTFPTVWCLIDESGSIGQEEATQFLTEIYSIAGMASVSVVCWDAEAYQVVKAHSRSEVISNVVGSLRGGGGTVVAPVLKKTLGNMRPRDLVTVFTDGDIYDLEQEDTKQLFSAVASKAGVAVLVSTHREVDVPMWRFVKLEAH